MMAIHPISLSKFAAGWLPALAVAASVDPAPRLADAFMLQAGGVMVPPVTCLLGAVGVLLARPLARRQESTLSWPAFALVSIIMLIVVQLWVIETRPGALFAFVIAIGLGFSGYSLIELIGDEVRAFLRNIVSRATAAIGGQAPPPDDGSPEDPKA